MNSSLESDNSILAWASWYGKRVVVSYDNGRTIDATVTGVNVWNFSPGESESEERWLSLNCFGERSKRFRLRRTGNTPLRIWERQIDGSFVPQQNGDVMKSIVLYPNQPPCTPKLPGIFCAHGVFKAFLSERIRVEYGRGAWSLNARAAGVWISADEFLYFHFENNPSCLVYTFDGTFYFGVHVAKVSFFNKSVMLLLDQKFRYKVSRDALCAIVPFLRN